MGRKRSSGFGNKVKARKKVTIKLLEREHGGKVTTPYRIMEKLVGEHHSHLALAKIAIAWRFGKKADADGRLQLGSCRKGSDLDRSLHGYDFVICLNHEAWNAAQFTEAMMVALLDHELCHAAVAMDSNGEPKLDEEGRTCYRIRKHDLEEFREIVARHGQWKEDIRQFVEAALRDNREAAKQPLLPAATNGHHGNGKTEPGDWRKVAINTLFGRGIAGPLIAAGIDTVGLLKDYADANSGRFDGITGIGPGKVGNIAEKMEVFWREHPEYAEAAAGE